MALAENMSMTRVVVPSLVHSRTFTYKFIPGDLFFFPRDIVCTACVTEACDYKSEAPTRRILVPPNNSSLRTPHEVRPYSVFSIFFPLAHAALVCCVEGIHVFSGKEAGGLRGHVGKS